MSARRMVCPVRGGGGVASAPRGAAGGAAGALPPGLPPGLPLESETVFSELINHLGEDLARIYAGFPRGVESGCSRDSKKVEV